MDEKFELPKPHNEKDQQMHAESSSLGIELGMHKSQPSQQQASGQVNLAGAQMTASSLGVVAPFNNPTQQYVATMQADDLELIEKHWIDRAKHLVMQTAHDPFVQNKEINKLKAEYIKKRYNKDIKV
jgi:hypothetical protein